MRDSIWIFVLLAVFLGVFTPAFAGASGPTTFHVGNEATSISTSSWTTVDEDAQRYFDNETVYYNGSIVEETEYQWATSNGSVRAVPGGQLDDASQITMSYGGERQDQWSRLLIPLLLVFFGVLTILLVWVAGDAIVGAIGIGGGR